MSYTKEQQEKFAKLNKQYHKKNKTLKIKIQEMEYCDWNPTARMLLLVIASGHRTNEEAWVQPDSPLSAEEMIGWCDMAQWRLAQRVGTTESSIQKYIKNFEDDGAIEVQRWEDSNHVHHDMYRVSEKFVDAHQRPDHKKDTKRPPRYQKKHTTPGAFKKGYDERRANQEKAMAMGEYGE